MSKLAQWVLNNAFPPQRTRFMQQLDTLAKRFDEMDKPRAVIAVNTAAPNTGPAQTIGLLRKLSKLFCNGWNFYKHVEINGKRKTMITKTIRAARKVNGRVEFYKKTFLMLLNDDGLVVYSNA